MRILHIAAHVGGGIGSAYIGLGTGDEDHHIILLEKPIDIKTLNRVEKAGFAIIFDADRERICKELDESDVVVINWSHHPAMTKFLVEFPPIPINSILWCHVSGNYYPQIPVELLKKFDQVMFATPYSLELPQVRALGEEYSQKHFCVVYGLNDLKCFGEVIPRDHFGFQVGYVGTLGFCKLHPGFVEFCSAVSIPDARFVLAGETSTKNQILEDAYHNGIDKKFSFLGRVQDVPNVLSEMDVFGYLLNPQHFGATENALLEAMASGVPVVAIDQCVERFIIEDGKTGLLVHSPKEYGAAIQYLREKPDKARELGLNARNMILKRYDIEKNRRRFAEACERALQEGKRILCFDDVFTGKPADWFLLCVDKREKRKFLETPISDVGRIFRETTKGSPLHYSTFFPEDRKLAGWAKELT